MADAPTAPDAPGELVNIHPHDATHRAVELFGIVAAAALVLTIGARVATSVTRGDAIFALLALVVGALLADLFSGFVHWAFDRFGNEKTPLVGPAFVKPFRLHHTDPKDILRHGFLETNGNTSLATVVPLALLLLVPLDSALGLVIVVAMTTASLLAILTNQLHTWAHDPSPPKGSAWLQSMHMVLPRDHHALHHAWPHESHYCITTGWMNTLLVRIHFWTGMERFLEGIVKMRAHRDPAPVELYVEKHE